MTRSGIILHGEERRVVILEPETRLLLECDPLTVAGSFLEHDFQSRGFPARLKGAKVDFVTDQHGQILIVNIIGGYERDLVITMTTCESCQKGASTLAASVCACGNLKNSAHKICGVCSIKKKCCCVCDTPIQ